MKTLNIGKLNLIVRDLVENTSKTYLSEHEIQSLINNYGDECFPEGEEIVHIDFGDGYTSIAINELLEKLPNMIKTHSEINVRCDSKETTDLLMDLLIQFEKIHNKQAIEDVKIKINNN